MLKKYSVIITLLIMIGFTSASFVDYDVYETIQYQGNNYDAVLLDYSLPSNVITWLNQQAQVTLALIHNGISYIIYNSIGSLAEDVVEAVNYKRINLYAQTIPLPQGYYIPNDCYVDRGNNQRHSVYFENNQIKFQLNDTRCYEYGYS